MIETDGKRHIIVPDASSPSGQRVGLVLQTEICFRGRSDQVQKSPLATPPKAPRPSRRHHGPKRHVGP